jgi:hypothetical protein
MSRSILSLSLLLSSVAFAGPPDDLTDQCTIADGDETIRVIWHWPEDSDDMWGPDDTSLPFTDSLKILDAFNDVNDTIESMGIAIDFDNVVIDDEPFVWSDWSEESAADGPIVRIGMFHEVCEPDGSKCFDNSAARPNCSEKVAHIGLKANGDSGGYKLGEPEDEGRNTYDFVGGYIRGVYIHELGHGLGLGHAKETVSVMNYGPVTWHNKDPNEQMRPLAADAAALRHLYGDDGEYREISILTQMTDWDDVDSDAGAAFVRPLCWPSIGDDYADRFESRNVNDDGIRTCGKTQAGLEGSRQVCPGDDLRVRIALSNPSTADLDVKLRMWLSADDVWDGRGVDAKSPTVRNKSIVAEHTSIVKRMWEVPQIAPGTYHVIIKGIGRDAADDPTGSWSAMGTTVTVPANCP